MLCIGFDENICPMLGMVSTGIDGHLCASKTSSYVTFSLPFVLMPTKICLKNDLLVMVTAHRLWIQPACALGLAVEPASAQTGSEETLLLPQTEKKQNRAELLYVE